MRRMGMTLGGLAALVAVVALVVVLGAGSASGAGTKKLVEGTVYDTTCATSCVPECPPIPCGPIPAPKATGSDIVCAQRKRIVACPLQDAAPVGTYPVYSGEGAVVKVRRRGSAKVLATLPVEEGHFKLRLGPGEYLFHPYPPEASCWSGEPLNVQVTLRQKGVIPVSLSVSDSCVAHPDSR